MTNEVASIKRFFNSRDIPLSDEWLKGCLTWCREDSPNITTQALQNKVFEQWLLLDVRDVNVPTLPSDLSTKTHYILAGNYSLQIMQVVDISKPKLWQIQKIRNTNILTRGIQQDCDMAGTGKRMLQLSLTDGIQQVEAMEYKPIKDLNFNLTPGIKILLKGPVTVRRGRIMLESKNVEILGGEVDELAVSNAAENVLARLLNLPENPNPFVVEEKLLTTNEENDKQEGYVVPNLPSNRPVIKKQTNNKPTSIQTMPKQSEIDEEIRLLLEAEQDILNESRPDQNLALFEGSINENDFETNRFFASSTQISPQNVKKQKTSVFNDIEENDVFGDMDIEAHLDKLDHELENNLKPSKIEINTKSSNLSLTSPKKIQNTQFSQKSITKQTSETQKVEKTTLCNTISIINLLEKKKCVGKGKFKIKARFKNVVEKLTMGEEYNLIINIEDQSGELSVKVHTDLISDVMGCCPAALSALKNDILNKNEQATDKLYKVIFYRSFQIFPVIKSFINLIISGNRKSERLVACFR